MSYLSNIYIYINNLISINLLIFDYAQYIIISNNRNNYHERIKIFFLNLFTITPKFL